MTRADIFNPPLPDAGASRVVWSGLPDAALSLALAAAARANPGPLLVVTDGNETAERLRRELRFFSQLPVFSLPDWETLPYDNFSPHQDIISERLHTLYHLPGLQQGLLVLSFNTLMHRLPPASHLLGNALLFDTGDEFDADVMRQRLVAAGYQHVESVAEHGEFAVRGSIMDLFPMGLDAPLRLDLFGNEIDSIRTFDPETQRSLDRVEKIHLLPGKEYPIDEAGVMTFRARFRERFDVDLRHCPLYQDVSEGIASPGLEYYLALFYPQLSSLLDYLPRQTLACRVGALEQSGQEFWREIRERHADRAVDRFRPILDPGEIFLTVEQVFEGLGKLPQVLIATGEKTDFAVESLPDLSVNPRLQEPSERLQQFLARVDARRVLFCAESAGRREMLLDLLQGIQITPDPVPDWPTFLGGSSPVAITVAALDQGLSLREPALALITEAQLFGGRVAQRRRRNQSVDNTELVLRNLSELRHGDAVVHIEHGVGRYRGLQTLTIDAQDTEFLTLEYAGQTKLYVPVASLHLISRYSGADPELAPLNQLGTDAWSKARRKAAEKIRDVAAELLEIYARREARKGTQYRCRDIELEKFSGQFPFEETDDQVKSINAVVADMESTRPMDRLICGDVGFGKTEVAMRAAFIAVQNHKQVAVLVPTTLLAQQHFASFRDRFADWPVKVEVISRFKSNREQLQILKELESGKIDILIGTHKLLNNDIRYRDLGLLVVDEEHRFGVRQKDKLKALRANVDILTLTATPIPRTLNLALSGVRDLSLIVTPPAKRLSVRTFIRNEQDSLIKEAIWRELLRGGQVFFLHNEVKTIETASAHLQELIPQARIAVAHGQMPERELEKVMADFYHKRFNVLVCSTIIETGIDVPSANTIIIRRADRFGLAQLHQLRGRVGRSHHQAYAYLMIPHHKEMTADAHKRIEAIQAATALGSGFTLASHDLEIRGAGELLGDEQSGHIQKIGFTLYMEMLDDAVAAIRAGRLPDSDLSLDHVIEINLRIPALIPETYLPDVHTRLIMYKRIASADSRETLDELKAEMIDRFGMLPEPLKLLFRVTALKLQAQVFGIRKIDANISNGRVEFGRHTTIDPLSIVQLVQAQPQHYKLGGANQLNFVHQAQAPEQRLDFIEALLQRLRLTQTRAST